MKKKGKFSLIGLALLTLCWSNAHTQYLRTPQKIETQQDFYGVWFTSETTGIIVGGYPGSCVYRTTDAGLTWNLLTYPDPNNYRAGICFSDSLHGWVSGSGGSLMKTIDGGDTWNLQSSGTVQNLEAFFCTDEDTAWAGGAYGTIVHTADGGENWYSQESGISSHIHNIYFIDSDSGFAVGGGCAGCADVATIGAYILRTTNGGVDWSVQVFDTTVTGLYDVSFANSNTGIAVGSGGTILCTADGGVTWEDHSDEAWPELWDVFFIDEETAFVVGGNWHANTDGIVLYTEDSGTTWTEQDIPMDTTLNKVFFTNALTGIAVGNNGTILNTTDGGANWILYHEVPDQVNEISESRVSLYPNPSPGNVIIDFKEPAGQIISVELLDITGKVVYHRIPARSQTTELSIDMSPFEEGPYFIRIYTTEYTFTERILHLKR